MENKRSMWKNPITMAFAGLLVLGLVAFGINKKGAVEKSEVKKESAVAYKKAKTAMHYFVNPHDLLELWDTIVPYPKESYSKEEIATQEEINEKTADGIMSYSPKGKKKEWTQVDYEEITPFTWKWVDMDLPKPDGSLTQISLRRPNWWLRKMGADSVGKKIYLDMPELGSQGWATVKRVRINQLDSRFWKEKREGDYVSRPVTGKFTHESKDVYEMHFGENEQALGVTGSHPIWSLDRNGWVGARELKIGERVKTQDGTTVLKSRVKLHKKQKVYNLEVYKDHNFLVSLDRILVHNSCITKDFVKKGGTQSPNAPEGWGNGDVADLLGWAKTSQQNTALAASQTREFAEKFTKSDIVTLKEYGFTREHFEGWEKTYKDVLDKYAKRNKTDDVQAARLESTQKILSLWE